MVLVIPYVQPCTQRELTIPKHNTLSREGDIIGTRKTECSQRTETAKDRLAERVGFEPTSRLLVNTLSKRAPSATRTPLRGFAPRAHPEAVLPDRHANSRQPDQYTIGRAEGLYEEQASDLFKVQTGYLKRRRKRNSTPKTPFWSRIPSTETLSLIFHSNWMMRYCE